MKDQFPYAQLLAALEDLEDAKSTIHEAWLPTRKIIPEPVPGSPGIVFRPLYATRLKLEGAVERALAAPLPPSISFEFLEKRLQAIEHTYVGLIDGTVTEPNCEGVRRLINQVDAANRASNIGEPDNGTVAVGVSATEAMPRDTIPNAVGPDSASDDEQLPKRTRKHSPSRLKAKALYDWAISDIPNADQMTIYELYDAIEHHPSGASSALPPNSETFGKYLRDAGVRIYSRGKKTGTRSVKRLEEL